MEKALEIFARGLYEHSREQEGGTAPAWDDLSRISRFGGMEALLPGMTALKEAGLLKGDQPVTDPHDLVISAGDEELWIKCSCGHVVQPSPWPQTKPLEQAWDAWYWPHAIKEHIKQCKEQA